MSYDIGGSSFTHSRSRLLIPQTSLFLIADGRIAPRASARDLYLLFQFGGRFSAKARAPSRASSVPCSQLYSSRSSLSPSASGRSRPRRAACLIRETASGALLQISLAISSHLLMS